MISLINISSLLVLFSIVDQTLGVEFTFELEDNAKQCFFQDIEKGTSATLDFQVVSGGKYDVDCTLEDPDGLKLNTWKRKQYDAYEWDAQKSGAYQVCFSNEFSTITHKVVYFSLNVGSEGPLIEGMSKVTALSQIESSCVGVHDKLKGVINFQTHFRLREAHGRAFAEGLNTRVQIWSFINLMIVVLVMVGQVAILRSFFSNKHHRAGRTDT